MDKSETYIKMCEKAEEIQDIISMVDFVPAHSNEPCYSGNGVYWDGEKAIIWLPRQDQLQEMLFTLGEGVLAQVVLLKEFVQEMREGILQFTSMEQLWLAFVMKEKYGKIWDGKKWVKEK